MAEPNVQPVDFYIERSGIKCLVYGRAGIGKTRLALTCPNPIVLNVEGGIRSLQGSGIPAYPPINSLADLIGAYNWLKESASAKKYATVYIDSISEIAEVVLARSKQNFKDGRLAYQDALDVVMNGAVRRFRDLPGKNVIFTAKEDIDTVNGVQMFQPAMPSKAMRNELPYFFDEVFRMVGFADQTTGIYRPFLQCGLDAVSFAKDRSGKLAQWEDPHLGNIFNKMSA